METAITFSQLDELLRDGADVTTTVYDLGEARLRLFTKGSLWVAQVSGVYSPAVGRELEKVLQRCNNNLGLLFRDITGKPGTPKFDSSLIGILKKIRARLEGKSKSFYICDPPPELVDFLKLRNAYETFCLGAATGRVGQPQRHRKSATRKWKGKHAAESDVHRKIKNLSLSLDRTAELEKGLDTAAKYVEKMLPTHPPEIPGLEIAYCYKTSEKVGGDFFDFVTFNDASKLGVCIGDVSGHGFDAAFLMGISKKVIQLRARDRRYQSPCQVLRQASADLSDDFLKNNFVTAVYGIFDSFARTFTFARAGHEYPILLGPGRGEIMTLASPGGALGLNRFPITTQVMEDCTVHMEAGSTLVLFTDGLPEARNSRQAFLGRKRLLYEMSNIDASANCKQLMQYLLECFESFTRGAPQEDDITIVLVKSGDE